MPTESTLHSSLLELRPLADIARRTRIWKGMEIGIQGQPCDSLYIIVDGQVLLSRRSPAGEDHALYLLGSGDLFGEGSLNTEPRWMVSARAVTDGSMYVLAAAQLPRFAQYYPQVTAQVVALLSARLERAHRRVDLITIDSARERVVGLLEVLAEHHGDRRGRDVWLPLRLTQAELGEMVGLARETVARALAELEAEGHIRREGRRGMWLCYLNDRPDATRSPVAPAAPPRLPGRTPSA